MLSFRPNFRRLAVAAGIILLLFVGAWVFMFLNKDSGPKLARENIRKIKAGMSETEVEAIVGARPTFHSEDSGTDVQTWTNRQVRWTKADGWVSEEAELTVMYDEDGRVVRTRYYESGQPLSLLERLRNQIRYCLRW